MSICDVGLETTYPITKSTLNPDAEPLAKVPTTTAFCSDNIQTIFLQTARAIIHHPSKPHNTREVCIILDGESQKSYLSESAQDLLKLEPTGEQALSIVTFGSSKGTAREPRRYVPLLMLGCISEVTHLCHYLCM